MNCRFRHCIALGMLFTGLVATAAAQGYPDLRMLVLPHPMEARPEREVRTIARARFDDLIGLLATTR